MKRIGNFNFNGGEIHYEIDIKNFIFLLVLREQFLSVK